MRSNRSLSHYRQQYNGWRWAASVLYSHKQYPGGEGTVDGGKKEARRRCVFIYIPSVSQCVQVCGLVFCSTPFTCYVTDASFRGVLREEVVFIYLFFFFRIVLGLMGRTKTLE